MVISDTQLRVQYHLFVRGSQTGKFKGKDGCKGEELRKRIKAQYMLDMNYS